MRAFAMRSREDAPFGLRIAGACADKLPRPVGDCCLARPVGDTPAALRISAFFSGDGIGGGGIVVRPPTHHHAQLLQESEISGLRVLATVDRLQ